MLKIMKIFSLCLLMIVGCGNNMKVIMNSDVENIYYSIPFNEGFIQKINDKIKIVLRFYRPNKPFKKDTDERVHLYILASGIDTYEDLNNNKMKVFFIRVQLSPSYGYLEPEMVNLTINRNNKLILSCNLNSTMEYPFHKDLDIKTTKLLFQELPLEEVENIDYIIDTEYDYYKSILNEFFIEWK